MIEHALIVSPILLMLAYPVYVLLMAVVLRAVGVERKEIAKWALRQADRQRLIDLIRAVRGTQPEVEQTVNSN
jgi:biopolymer transport protein ExbB/TolQ